MRTSIDELRKSLGKHAANRQLPLHNVGAEFYSTASYIKTHNFLLHPCSRTKVEFSLKQIHYFSHSLETKHMKTLFSMLTVQTNLVPVLNHLRSRIQAYDTTIRIEPPLSDITGGSLHPILYCFLNATKKPFVKEGLLKFLI